MTEEENQAQMEERQMSEAVDELFSAMSKVQAEVSNAHKSESNPFFKSKYADLKSCWDACRDALTKNGISVIQMPVACETGIAITTMLTHSSGQWIKSTLPVPVSKNDAQGVGSAITYGRRYGLSAMVGIAPEDDDGNAATKAPPKSYEQLITPYKETITGIKHFITEDNLSAAAELWFELDDEEKKLIWKAPTKGGCFNQDEFKTIKSKEFREAHFGTSKEEAA